MSAVTGGQGGGGGVPKLSDRSAKNAGDKENRRMTEVSEEEDTAADYKVKNGAGDGREDQEKKARKPQKRARLDGEKRKQEKSPVLRQILCIYEAETTQSSVYTTICIMLPLKQASKG